MTTATTDRRSARALRALLVTSMVASTLGSAPSHAAASLPLCGEIGSTCTAADVGKPCQPGFGNCYEIPCEAPGTTGMSVFSCDICPTILAVPSGTCTTSTLGSGCGDGFAGICGVVSSWCNTSSDEYVCHTLLVGTGGATGATGGSTGGSAGTGGATGVTGGSSGTGGATGVTGGSSGTGGASGTTGTAGSGGASAAAGAAGTAGTGETSGTAGETAGPAGAPGVGGTSARTSSSGGCAVVAEPPKSTIGLALLGLGLSFLLVDRSRRSR